MKKFWLTGFAIAIGACTVAGRAEAQYGAPVYGSGALAPNGYVINKPGILARPVAYPQEQVATPGYNAQQVPTQGWVGPQNGQYQGVPIPQVPNPPQPVPMNPPGSQVPYSGPIVGTQPQPAPGQLTYPMDPAYAQSIAPNATGYSSCGCNGGAPQSYDMSGYATSSCGTGACSTGSCGYPTYNSCGVSAAGYAGFGSRFLSLGSGCNSGGNWFVGGGALLFQRVDDHPVALSYNVLMPTENTLTTRDARQNNLPGFEVFAGRYFNCGRNAILFDYWGLFPGDKSATVYNSGSVDLRSRYQFGGLYGPVTTIYDYYDNTQAHRIVRGSSYNNVEVNLLGFAIGGAGRTYGYGAGSCGSSCGDCSSCCTPCSGGFTGPCSLAPGACGSRLNLSWLGGIRWFQFRDRLQYATSTADTNFTGAADDFYYDNNVRNDLVGFQLGNVLNYCCGSRFNLYAFSKAGVYNNRAQLLYASRHKRHAGYDPKHEHLQRPELYGRCNS
ncbi:MAG: hypothetical protein U0892_11005 [Pirellulales bacterium]